ncbi:MAG: hypothetical protein B7X93_03040 [Hydrogenophilales bacterium 17-61-9]|nr:MAG: hypothetical protein B7X93_03040 [Hydrogenophilales bacterium 17-61-9]
MKIKVSEATKLQLDWLVAKCEARKPSAWVDHESGKAYVFMQAGDYRVEAAFSTAWTQGGPIIEREHMEFDYDAWTQMYLAADGSSTGQGKTHLIAAMRCFVASKLGDEVEVPDELC